VRVGDVGFIRDGYFQRLFNALLPADHPSHDNFGVPEWHEPLLLNFPTHIRTSIDQQRVFTSQRVMRDSFVEDPYRSR
jgi:hypothetical protein